jgi:hypothetical protein
MDQFAGLVVDDIEKVRHSVLSCDIHDIGNSLIKSNQKD